MSIESFASPFMSVLQASFVHQYVIQLLLIPSNSSARVLFVLTLSKDCVACYVFMS